MTRQERIERAFRQGAITEQERDAALADANMRDFPCGEDTDQEQRNAIDPDPLADPALNPESDR
jgi:hypothetical protein